VIDHLTRRSALISTIVHATLVVAVWWTNRGDSPEPSPTQAVPVPPTVLSPAEPDAGAAIEVVSGDDGPGAALRSPPLPPLDRADHHRPMPPMTDPALVVPLPTGRAERDPAVGRGLGSVRELDLPVSDLPAATALDATRARGAAPDLDHVMRMRQTARDHLDGRLRAAYRAHWRRFATQIAVWKLIVRITVDARGRVVDAGLENSTGAPELDRLIENWLRRGDIGMPPIPPGVPQRFLVSLQ
jgi:hypothetical protein